jgi:hypothetical protein
MTEPGDEFENFLKTRTLLPNDMSDDDKLEPPKALDAIVLRKAREAIRARRPLNRTPRWATPVALAATILLCLSIVLNVRLNTNRPAANLRQMTAATADKASPAPASPASPGSSAVPDSSASRANSASSAAPAARASPASDGERREKSGAGIASHEAILPETKVVESRAPRPPVVAEAATPLPSEAKRANASAADKAEVLANRTRAATHPSSEAPSAAADKAAQLADRSRTPAQAPADTPSTSNSAADSVASSAARGDAGTAAPRHHPQDPKAWLQQIAALRADGKTAQADAEMRRFRAAFPAYPAKPTPPAPSEPPN